MQLTAVVTTSLLALASSFSTTNGDTAMRQLSAHNVAGDTKEYIVGLRLTPDGDNFCTGALISPMHVLSSSSCMRNAGLRWVSIGSRFSNGTIDGEQIKVVAIMNHPDYDPMKSLFTPNDFMVLKLEKRSTFKYVGLPAADDSFFKTGKQVATLGWNTESEETTTMSYKLQRMDLKLVSDKECRRTLSAEFDPSMVCTEAASGHLSSVDFGRPLILEDRGIDDGMEDVLIGLLIVIVYPTSEAEGSPSVYSRVSTVRPWIDSITSHVAKNQWR